MTKPASTFDHWPRKIIHIDMDAFFAAIEQRDHPEYQGKPVIVGGDPDGRGVVSTCSYEARRFGIHSAMPAAQAKKLCPHGIYLRPNIDTYREASRQIMSILRQHTDLVQPASLDEAYLDVSAHRLGISDPVLVADLIRQNIHAVVKLTASAGVAPNKFLAKIASDFNKPDGLTVVEPDGVEAFLEPLSVRKIPGVGPQTEAALAQLRVHTCVQLALKSEAELIRHFGKYGHVLYERAQGRDDRAVISDWEPTQSSTEETFSNDITDIEWLVERLRGYAEKVFTGLQRKERMGRTIVLKVKYFDFESITRSKTLPHEPKDAGTVYDVARQMLLTRTEAGTRPIRLLGLGISGLHDIDADDTPVQGELF